MRLRACSIMRSFFRHILVLFLLNACYNNVSTTDTSRLSLDDAQTSNLRRVVSKMIGVESGGNERQGGRRWSAVDMEPVFTGRSRSPPRHIYRVYERYRDGDVVHGADTIRSVNAQLALVQNFVLYAFDVSPISQESEDVVYSEIHLYERRRRRWPRWSNRSPDRDLDITVSVYELTPSSLVQSTSLTLTRRSARWQSLNVTDIVSACVDALRDRSTPPTMIAVSFANKSVNGSGNEHIKITSRLRFSTFRRRFSRPSLIVYSRQKPVEKYDDDEEEEEHERMLLQDVVIVEDVQNTGRKAASKDAESRRRGQVGVSNIDNKNRNVTDGKTATGVGATKQRLTKESTKHEVMSSHQQSIGQRQRSAAGGRNRRHPEQSYERRRQGNSSADATAAGRLKYAAQNRMAVADAADVLRRPRRAKRGVLNNEVDVPDDDVGHGPGLAAGYVEPPRTSPGLLRGRQKVTSRPHVASIFTQDDDTERLLDPIFDIGDRKNEDKKRKRRKSRVRGRRRKQSSLMTLLRNPDDYFNVRRRSMAAGDTCKKKQLRVNFDEIGWSEWIIAPDFFDAFYCDGSCSFPIARKLRPTNHATIQSIARAAGIQTDLPSPCCVPASLTSVTLLYFDRHYNVVLRNFPEMSVRSCACR